jgi:glycosyltransferase involved in cell wall biosynthesis
MHPDSFDGKRILITHFRVGKSDGVSLEIDSWKRMFESKGAEVALCAGPESIDADYVIRDLEMQFNDSMYEIDQDSFDGLEKFKSPEELKTAIVQKQFNISKEFNKVIKDFRPTHFLASNIFSVGLGIPVAGALTKVLDKYQIASILIHHDFYYEKIRRKKTSTPFIKDQLKKYFPPKRNYIKHMCINKLGQKSLKQRKGLNAGILHDTFDYNQPAWEVSNKSTSFLRKMGIKKSDLIILQATRIIRRKNIELAIDFTKKLQEKISKRDKFKLYDGRNFDPTKHKVKLVLSGYVEKTDLDSLDKLMDYAEKQNVSMIYLGNKIDKEYNLFDIYPHSDLITYPSAYEGFGNQLLEAFFARRPVVVYEYPVFKTDIKDLDLEIISLRDDIKLDEKSQLWKLDSQILKNATAKAIKILTDSKKYKTVTNHNFRVAKSNFGFDKTLKIFAKLL